MSELAVSLSCQDESEVFHQIKSPLHLWRVFHVETLNKLWIWYELALPSWIKGNSCGHFVKGDIHPVYLLLYLTFKYQRFTSLYGEYLKKKACIWLNRWNKFLFQGSANPICLNQHNSRISWSKLIWLTLLFYTYTWYLRRNKLKIRFKILHVCHQPSRAMMLCSQEVNCWTLLQ